MGKFSPVLPPGAAEESAMSGYVGEDTSNC